MDKLGIITSELFTYLKYHGYLIPEHIQDGIEVYIRSAYTIGKSEAHEVHSIKYEGDWNE